MATEEVEALIEGGQASAGPPIGSSLGPLGVNIGQVVDEINEKTKHFDGMQVPVKVTVDTDTKDFEIEVGTPPTSALLFKEAEIDSGSGNPGTKKVYSLLIEHAIKVAKMKEDDLLGKTLKDKVKEVIGTCRSTGILIENSPSQEIIEKVNEGEFDDKIKAEKTELDEEDEERWEQQNKELEEERKRRREELRSTAEEIIDLMEGEDREVVRERLRDEDVPEDMIEELLPTQVSSGIDIPEE